MVNLQVEEVACLFAGTATARIKKLVFSLKEFGGLLTQNKTFEQARSERFKQTAHFVNLTCRLVRSGAEQPRNVIPRLVYIFKCLEIMSTEFMYFSLHCSDTA